MGKNADTRFPNSVEISLGDAFAVADLTDKPRGLYALSCDGETRAEGVSFRQVKILEGLSNAGQYKSVRGKIELLSLAQR